MDFVYTEEPPEEREGPADCRVAKPEDHNVNPHYDFDCVAEKCDDTNQKDRSNEKKANHDHYRPFTNFYIENILNSDFGGEPKLIRHRCLRGHHENRDYDETKYGNHRDYLVDVEGYHIDYSKIINHRDEKMFYNNVINETFPMKKDKVSVFSRKKNSSVTLHRSESRTALDLSRKIKGERLIKDISGDSRDGNSNGEGCESSVTWPAWVFCTRYSDRPSAGPRTRKSKNRKCPTEKRPRTAFSKAQLERLKVAFDSNQYLTEASRVSLSTELQLSQSQIKIWFQNKRAKLKKSSGCRNSLAAQLTAQGLYNHGTGSQK